MQFSYIRFSEEEATVQNFLCIRFLSFLSQKGYLRIDTRKIVKTFWSFLLLPSCADFLHSILSQRNTSISNFIFKGAILKFTRHHYLNLFKYILFLNNEKIGDNQKLQVSVLYLVTKIYHFKSPIPEKTYSG